MSDIAVEKMDEPIKRLRCLDFFMGLGFLAIGVFVALDGLAALRSPALAMVEKASNPGISTLFVGSALGLLGLVLACIGLQGSRAPLPIAGRAVAASLRSRSFWRGCIVLACIAVYFFGFWGRLPYTLSTFIFLTGMMFIFRAGAWWKIVLISGTAVTIVWYIFGVLAMVPLP